MSVTVGVTVRVDDPGRFAELAMLAENVGLESIWRGEHLLRPLDGFTGYPYGPGDHLGTYAVLDPLHLVTAAAVVTERIVIGAGVLILPLWDPLLLARAVRTAALACRGRLAIGVGVGWSEPEFALAGKSFAERGITTDRLLQLLSEAMSSGVVQAPGGAAYLFDPAVGDPPTPAIELLVGGDSPPALRRASRFGGGWYGHLDQVDLVEQRMRSLDRWASATVPGFARGKRTVRVPGDTDPAVIGRLADVGVERIIVPLLDAADPASAIRRVAAMVEHWPVDHSHDT